MIRKRVVSIFLICFILSFAAQAAVYQCVNDVGQIEFRDTPCQISSDTQLFLPYQYEKTKTDLKTIQKEARIAKKTEQAQAKEDRKKIRQAARLKKKTEKERQKAEKRALRCAKIQDKIKEIELALTRGCKLKRYNHLQSELLHFRSMKKRYCDRS